MEEQANSQIPELTGTPVVLTIDMEAVKDFDDMKYIISLWNVHINTTVEVFNQMGEKKKYFNMNFPPAAPVKEEPSATLVD